MPPLLPLSSFCNLWRLRIVAARGSWKSGETGRSEAARKMIFFEIEAEFRRGRDSRSELVDRFLSRYSSIRSLLSSQARLMCDSSSKRRGNVFSNRSRIYIYLSFRGQFLLLFFEYENTVLSRIMEERQELPAFRFQIHSIRVINKIAHRFHNRKETSHRRGKKERKRKKISSSSETCFSFSPIIIAVLSRSRAIPPVINNDDPSSVQFDSISQ